MGVLVVIWCYPCSPLFLFLEDVLWSLISLSKFNWNGPCRMKAEYAGYAGGAYPSFKCIRNQSHSTVGTHIRCVCVWNSYKVGGNECPRTKSTCKTTVTWYWNLVAPKSRFLSQEISLCFVLFYCWDVASCNQEIVIQWILLPRIAGSDLLGQYPVPV
jgi:hypothetical protein